MRSSRKRLEAAEPAVQMNTRVPKSLRDEVVEVADRRGLSISALMAAVVRRGLDTLDEEEQTFDSSR